MLTLITAIWLFSGPKGYWVTIQPLDFQDPVNPDLFIRGIAEVSSNGEDIFIAEHRSPSFYRINRRGKVLESIHAKGQGPGKIGRHYVRAMVAGDQGFWAIDNAAKYMHYFEGGVHHVSFPLKSFQIGLPYESSDQFAFNHDTIVVPAFPGKGVLAHAYRWDGTFIKDVGKIWPKDLELLRKTPALNDTIWTRDDKYWYALFQFRPFIRVYDQDLELVRQMRLRGPEIDDVEYELLEEEKPENFDHRRPHFVHFNQFGDHLYLLCRGVFYQIDKQSGETLSRVKFRGEGPEFAHTDPTRHLVMDRFCFLADGTLILAQKSLLWDHDLWTARLPFLEKNP